MSVRRVFDNSLVNAYAFTSCVLRPEIGRWRALKNDDEEICCIEHYNGAEGTIDNVQMCSLDAYPADKKANTGLEYGAA